MSLQPFYDLAEAFQQYKDMQKYHKRNPYNYDPCDDIANDRKAEMDECATNIRNCLSVCIEDLTGVKPVFGDLKGNYTALPPNYGDTMTVKQWLENVNMGGFIDYDGYGKPMKNGLIDNTIKVWPSKKNIPTDATHIRWYNR